MTNPLTELGNDWWWYLEGLSVKLGVKFRSILKANPTLAPEILTGLMLPQHRPKGFAREADEALDVLGMLLSVNDELPNVKFRPVPPGLEAQAILKEISRTFGGQLYFASYEGFEAVLEEHAPKFKRMNPKFTPEWVRKAFEMALWTKASTWWFGTAMHDIYMYTYYP